MPPETTPESPYGFARPDLVQVLAREHDAGTGGSGRWHEFYLKFRCEGCGGRWANISAPFMVSDIVESGWIDQIMVDAVALIADKFKAQGYYPGEARACPDCRKERVGDAS